VDARIAVLGAGSFGTALAIHLARRGHDTLLWGRDGAAMEAMEASRENAAYLPGMPLPARLRALGDLEAAVRGSADLLVATPSSALGATVRAVAPMLRPAQGIVCACKGLEPGTARMAHEVIAEGLPPGHPVAILSGPTFAKELAMGLPTAVTIASKDEAFAEKIARVFHGDGFRAYPSDDVVGVEIGGAAKNVMAIGVGIGDGLGLGANTRAGFITRSLNELVRLGVAAGARPETFMGLAGLGDLVLTCTDNQSRNRRFGLLLAEGKTPAEAAAVIGQVVEGAKAAAEVLRLAARLGVDTPITREIARVISGEIKPVEAVSALAQRPLRAEHD
jgi:glycerol-3-phosphate dehydrogenase (NAD(P)+)